MPFLYALLIPGTCSACLLPQASPGLAGCSLVRPSSARPVLYQAKPNPGLFRRGVGFLPVILNFFFVSKSRLFAENGRFASRCCGVVGLIGDFLLDNPQYAVFSCPHESYMLYVTFIHDFMHFGLYDRNQSQGVRTGKSTPTYDAYCTFPGPPIYFFWLVISDDPGSPGA